MVALRVPLAERFHKKVNRRGPDDCWLWTAGTNKKGYGQIQEDAPSRTQRGAHCVAYELHHGHIPDGLFVLHTCDNPPCVNPRHLFVGSHTENMQDMDSKGRRNAVRGEKHGIARLTEEKVDEIKREHISYSRAHGAKALSLKHGVHRATIGKIVRGETWNG